MKPKLWMKATLLVGMVALAALPLGIARAADEHDHMHMHAAHEHMDMEHATHDPMDHATHDHSAHTAAPASVVPESVSIKLSNKTLSDAEGHSLRLKSDVVGDHIVVVSFVYTTCTTVCPVVSAIFSDLQNKLGSRLDKDVRLVSLTVDPLRDTPSRLKNYSAQYGAKPGWFWLTGPSASVTEALKGFGAYTPNFEEHPVVVMIGDGKSGKWSRHYGLSNSEHLLTKVDEYLAERKKSERNKTVAMPTPHDIRS